MRKSIMLIIAIGFMIAADTVKIDEKLNGSYVGGGGETNGKPFTK